VKRNEYAVSVPRGSTLAFRRHSVSGREAAALVAVVAMLVPLLMFEGRVLSLPSLLERGVESLIPRLADGKPHLQPAAEPSRFGTLVGAALNGVVISVKSDRASRGGMSVASEESHLVTSSRGSRAASVRVPDAPQVPVPGGVTGASPPAGSSPPPTAGPSGGEGSGSGGPGPGGAGPGEPGTPGVSVGANGTTASVSVETGLSPATGTATVSASTSGVSVAGTGAGVSIGAGAVVPTDTGSVPTAAVTADTSQVAVSGVAATVGSVLAPRGG
jgi:hypothetical protein